MRESEAYPRALPGIRGAQDAATRRSTSCRAAASAAARRSTGRARSARRAATLAYWQRAFGLAGFTVDDARAVVRADGGAAVDRAVGRRRPTRTTKRSRAARAKLGIPTRGDPPQRQGLLEPRLLRHGLPDQREAVDAGHDDSRARSTAARRSSRARARSAFVAARRPRDGARRCAAMDARGVRADRAPASPCARARSSPRPARSARRRCCCAARVPDPHGARRQAHVPASDRRVRGADAGARSTRFAGAPQTIYSDHFLDTHADRRPDRLQARGAAAASDADGDHAARRTATRTRAGCASCRTCRC